jgi:ArsR family transcriptional regulator
LAEIQPKISRHLAQLRNEGLLVDRKQGQWVFYQLSPTLPEWIKTILNETQAANLAFLDGCHARLQAMGNRPERKVLCCS